jgi:hypothetical protein
MKPAIILAVSQLLIVDSAQACHHYATWHYKFPQSCRVDRFTALALRTMRVRVRPPAIPATVVSPPAAKNVFELVKPVNAEWEKKATQMYYLPHVPYW